MKGKPLADNIKQATWQREFKHVPESTLSFFLPSASAWPLNLCVIASLCGTSHTMTLWFLLCITYFYRVWHCGSRDCKLSAPWRLLTWSVGGEEAGESQGQRRRKQKFLSLVDFGGAFAIYFPLNSLAKIQFTYHRIHSLRVYNFIVFRMFTELCNQHHTHFYNICVTL